MAKLENKTKKELIEIILRKDDVEKDLRQEISDYLLKEDKLTNRVQVLESSYNNAIADCKGMSKALEDAKEEIKSLMRHNKKLNSYILISVMLLVGVAVALVLLVM